MRSEKYIQSIKTTVEHDKEDGEYRVNMRISLAVRSTQYWQSISFDCNNSYEESELTPAEIKIQTRNVHLAGKNEVTAVLVRLGFQRREINKAIKKGQQ